MSKTKRTARTQKPARKTLPIASARKLRELPGWAESLAEVNRTLRWPLGGDIVRLVGAFQGPPSIATVTPWLLYNMAVALDIHRWKLRIETEREERRSNVVSLLEHRARVQVRACKGEFSKRLERAELAFPFRPPAERAGGFGADGQMHEPSSPPWAPASHEGEGDAQS